MHVHQTGSDAQTTGVDDLIGGDIQTALQHGDLAVLDEQILHQHNAGDGMDHSSVFDEKFHIVPPFGNILVEQHTL